MVEDSPEQVEDTRSNWFKATQLKRPFKIFKDLVWETSVPTSLGWGHSGPCQLESTSFMIMDPVLSHKSPEMFNHHPTD